MHLVGDTAVLELEMGKVVPGPKDFGDKLIDL